MDKLCIKRKSESFWSWWKSERPLGFSYSRFEEDDVMCDEVLIGN